MHEISVAFRPSFFTGIKDIAADNTLQVNLPTEADSKRSKKRHQAFINTFGFFPK